MHEEHQNGGKTNRMSDIELDKKIEEMKQKITIEGRTALACLEELRELRGFVDEICEVPRWADEATRAENFDVENEIHRKLLVCNLSVSYDRIHRMEESRKMRSNKIDC